MPCWNVRLTPKQIIRRTNIKRMADSINVPLGGCAINKTSKRFVDIYVLHLVKKFRRYNNDRFVITISGLKNFVETKDTLLSYLFQQLTECNFEIDVEGSAKNIDVADIVCNNVSKNETYSYKYQIHNLTSLIDLSEKTKIPIVGIIIMRIVAQTIIKQKILYKAIVLDLDGTLWNGTLAEDGIDKIKRNLRTTEGACFVSFMNFIKLLAKELGIYIAICSRNDVEAVKSAFEQTEENIFPLKKQIDCLVANYNDKSDNINEIAKRLSIITESVVFIDDNQIVRDEVKKKMPEVFVPEWSNIEDVKTQLIVGCIFERNELSISSQERRLQYEIIQAERMKNDLPRLLVKMSIDDRHNEAKRLYSKSNQFKFSQQSSDFDDNAKSLYFEIYRENGSLLGICSALTYRVLNNTIHILNWAISCRYFEIGLEELILSIIANEHKGYKFVVNFVKSEYNNKVEELLDKYPEIFRQKDKNIEMVLSVETIEKLHQNTNLMLI